MNDYETLKEFWNNCFINRSDEYASEKFLEDDRINSIFKKYINKDSVILDYGCGSGWAVPEIYFTSKFKSALMVDQSINGINASKDYVSGSIKGVDVSYSTDTNLKRSEMFDFIFSCNVVDVVPNEIGIEILNYLFDSVKKDGYILLCLNPDFKRDEVINILHMEIKDNYIYKDGILRGNLYNIDDYYKILNDIFEIVEYGKFYITKEDKYERKYYLLRRK